LVEIMLPFLVTLPFGSLELNTSVSSLFIVASAKFTCFQKQRTVRDSIKHFKNETAQYWAVFFFTLLEKVFYFINLDNLT